MQDVKGQPGVGRVRDVLYRGLFEHLLHEVHIWQLVRDDEGRIVTWRLLDANRRTLESWGRTLSDVVGRTPDEIFPDVEATEAFMPIVSKIFETGEPHEWEMDFEGTGQTLRMVSAPVGDCFVSTGFDVSDSRHQERELVHALERLNEAIAAGGVGLWDWDLLTDHVRFSDEWKAQLGYEPHEIEDRFEEWRSRCHPDDVASTMLEVEAAMADPDHEYRVVFRMRHKDGSWRWIHARSSVIRGEDGTPLRMVGSHLDLTDRHLLDEHVREVQKLESLGTLAAGIAHDFNNLLLAITGNLSIVLDALPEDSEHADLLADVDEAALRAQSLTNQLLTFSTGGHPVREIADTRDVILGSAQFMTRGSQAHCEFELADELLNIDADVGQISQVLGNLVVNADQAMPGGGVIDVTARNLEIGRGHETGLPPGSYVQISVTDDGEGIPQETLGRIFDPFFTTKATGSGLGLATSHSIVANHGGRILVESEVGVGTSFHVFLPATTLDPPHGGEGEARTGSGRLLVMDDEPAVRTAMRRMLARLGYAAETVANGDEAVALYREALEAGDPFEAVILDLTIPGKPSGEQVLQDLLEVDADVVALVASGYAENDVLAHYAEHGFAGRLQKPFTAQALGDQLARILPTA